LPRSLVRHVRAVLRRLPRKADSSRASVMLQTGEDGLRIRLHHAECPEERSMAISGLARPRFSPERSVLCRPCVAGGLFPRSRRPPPVAASHRQCPLAPAPPQQFPETVRFPYVGREWPPRTEWADRS